MINITMNMIYYDIASNESKAAEGFLRLFFALSTLVTVQQLMIIKYKHNRAVHCSHLATVLNDKYKNTTEIQRKIQ